jgi:hypothetical protein
LATSAAVDCSSAFSQEWKGLKENEKRNIVFEVTFEGRIFFFVDIVWNLLEQLTVAKVFPSFSVV